MFGINSEYDSNGHEQVVIRVNNAKVMTLPHPERGRVSYNGLVIQQGVDYYVKPDGDNNANGLSWATALKTIQAAINKTVSLNSDRIFIAPATDDYLENLVITSKHNVSLIASAPTGNAERVTIRPATGKALVVNQSKSLYVEGISFYSANNDAVVSDGEGAIFVSCDFRSDGGSGFVFLSATDTYYTGSGTVIAHSMIRECSSATGALLVKKGTGVSLGLQATNVSLIHNQFLGNTGPDIADDAGSLNPTYFYDWLIERNSFQDVAAKTTFLNMKGGRALRMMIRDNDFGQTLNNVRIKIPATEAAWVRNYDPTGLVTQATIT